MENEGSGPKEQDKTAPAPASETIRIGIDGHEDSVLCALYAQGYADGLRFCILLLALAVVAAVMLEIHYRGGHS